MYRLYQNFPERDHRIHVKFPNLNHGLEMIIKLNNICFLQYFFYYKYRQIQLRIHWKKGMNTKEVNFVFLCLVHYKGWVGGSGGGQSPLKKYALESILSHCILNTY